MSKRHILVKFIWIGLVCVALCGCGSREKKEPQKVDVNTKDATFIFGRKGEVVPGTKHYQLACVNQANCFVIEGDTIYRLDGENKTKMVSDIGIKYFSATDSYIYYYTNSSKTDRLDQLNRLDIRLKLSETFAFEDIVAKAIPTDGDTAYIEHEEVLYCYTGETTLVRTSDYVVSEEENLWDRVSDKEEWAKGIVDDCPFYEVYYLEWEGVDLFVFGRNENADYAFLSKIDNPLGLDTPESRVVISDKKEEPQDIPSEVIPEEGTFDGYDEFGNGYVIKDSIKFYDRDCPYELRDMEYQEGVVTWYQEGKDMDVSMILCEEYIRAMIRQNKEEEPNVVESFSMKGGLDVGPCVGVYKDRVIYHCTVYVTFAEEEK